MPLTALANVRLVNPAWQVHQARRRLEVRLARQERHLAADGRDAARMRRGWQATAGWLLAMMLISLWLEVLPAPLMQMLRSAGT